MKSNKIYSSVFMVLFVGMAIASSAQKITKTTTVNIEDYFPGPNFMKMVASEDNGLNLTEVQQNKFALWGEENQPKVKVKLQKISKLEKEMNLLSRKGAKDKKILEKQEQAVNLRKEIAITKFKCHDFVMETLSAEQWKTLVTNYETNFPFVERTRMMEVIQHVNPVPNYMQVIQKDSEGLNLSSDQKNKFDNWSTEHHPKMMEMANGIIALEKEIYQESLQTESDADLLEKIVSMNKLRTEIVETKSSCRNMLMENLNKAQWAALVEKI